MNTVLIRIASCLGAVALLSGASSVALAQDKWPSKPVRVVVPFPAGSAPDVLLRHIAGELTKKWGHAMVIDNKPGGSGVIGINALLSSPQDQHVFGFAQGSALAIVPRTVANVTYDYPKDFVPIALAATTPIMIAVKAESPYKTLEDLVSAAKAKPESVEIADVGRATVPHLAAMLTGAATGTKFLHVHFQGGPPAIQATLGGQTQAVYESFGPLMALVNGGKLRVLASMSDRVEPGLEKYPLANKVAPGSVVQGWFTFVGKRDTNADVVTKLNADVNEILRMPSTIAKFHEMGAFPRPGTPGDVDAFIKAEQKYWGGVIDRLGVKPE